MYWTLMDHSKGEFKIKPFFLSFPSPIYSSGICHVLIISRKCNMEMVELLPLEKKEDLAYVAQLLKEFNEKTGSKIARDLLAQWPKPASQFIKVLNTQRERGHNTMTAIASL